MSKQAVVQWFTENWGGPTFDRLMTQASAHCPVSTSPATAAKPKFGLVEKVNDVLERFVVQESGEDGSVKGLRWVDSGVHTVKPKSAL